MTQPPADYSLREATPDDAAALGEYRRAIADEPHNNVTWSPGEYKRTVEEERDRIELIIMMPTSRLILAVADETIIGMCSVVSISQRFAVQHVVGLGIDVAQGWRGCGVGSALLRDMVEWTYLHPKILRLELEVFTRNTHAIHLYKKFGFVEEGIRRKAYFKDGYYVDAMVMSILFEE